MQESDDEERALTPEESWRSIHTTMDSARSSMYVAGAATIALLWGGIAALGYLSHVRPPDARARFYDEQSLDLRCRYGPSS